MLIPLDSKRGNYMVHLVHSVYSVHSVHKTLRGYEEQEFLFFPQGQHSDGAISGGALFA